MSAARVAERTVAAGCRVHSAQFGVGGRGPSSGLGGAGVLAVARGRGGHRLLRLLARGPPVPAVVAGGHGHRRGPTPVAPGPVSAAAGRPRGHRRTRRGAGDRARGSPRRVGDDGGPWCGRMCDGPAHVPRGPGAQQAAANGGAMGAMGGRGCRSGFRAPLPAVGPTTPAGRLGTPQRSRVAAGGDGDALSRGGTSGASCGMCGRRFPDPGGLRTCAVRPAPRTERLPPS